MRAEGTKGRLMRWVICVLAVSAFAPRAFADDFAVLRGTQTATYHWGGIYGGVQGGDSSGNVNFGNAASSQIAYILRQTAIEQDQNISSWTVLPSANANSLSYGGFVGYNTEWEDLILGLEVNYNHVSLSTSSSDGLSRSFTDSTNLPAGHHYYYTVTVGANSSLTLTDIAEFRARAGWEAGIFLPYAFGGFAVGRANFSTSATVSYTAFDTPDVQTPPTPPLTPLPNLAFGPATQTNGQNNALLYGFAVGLGTDVALAQNIFVRGEVEYVRFAPLNGLLVAVTSARVGAGLKF